MFVSLLRTAWFSGLHGSAAPSVTESYSNQFICTFKWTFVPDVMKFPPGVYEI